MELHSRNTSLRHLPKRPPIDIEFHDVSYTVPQGRKDSETEEIEESKLNRKGLNKVKVISDITLRAANFVLEESDSKGEKEGKEDSLLFKKSW
ncbi:unnamed protein product [Diabrotica balteata]|uniref:Uncharacterized protein n=1 Tax=Diabrotica balteata TaxID=107213 RepID=A0A9N9XEQ4_DIABA|nr:unnamed protein product [Diabrotica balteata]